MTYIAYCTKGLEKIVQDEIQTSIPDVHIQEIADKRIIFTSDASYEQLTALKTVDDLGLLVAKQENISSIEDVLSLFASVDFKKIYQTLATYRNVDPQVFSVTISIAKSSLQAKKLLPQLLSYIQSAYSWQHDEIRHTNFDMRLFIDQKQAYISIRVTNESMHHRIYKTSSQLGSLRPTVAAAMVQLATNGNTHVKIVDNFCGGGTILEEAKRMGNDVYGGDINPESVLQTKKTLENIKLLDATKTPWQPHFFDAAISNLPWDQQVKVDSITDLYTGTLREYARIIKADGTICLLVSKPELLIKHAKEIFPKSTIESYKIGLLGQTPTIVVIKSEKGV